MKKNKESHKFLRTLNSQAALEYLITYGWAFLGIMATVSALYYFGIFDFSKFLPERCILTSQMECLAFVMNENSIKIRLVNNLGETIAVESMTVTDTNEPALRCTPPSPITGWKTGDEMEFLFKSCSGGGYVKRERVEAKISITYYAEDTPSKPKHTVNGKLQGRVG